jgi:Fructose/tagatose bisphosphate aldolase
MKYIHEMSEPVFAFNIWDVNSAKSIIDAAAKLQKSVVLQTSSRIFSILDKKEIYQYIKSYAERKQIKAYLHLDHCRDFHVICEAIDSNWDSVMFDGSHLSLNENILQTNKVCSIAHRKGILVEAEVGKIKGAEEDLQVVDASIASFSEIQCFLEQTSVDLFAASIGTAHGLYQGVPKIHYDMIAKINNVTKIPFVIHGGTGLAEDVFYKLLSYKNVKKINISTDVKQSYRKALVNVYQDGLLQENGFEATAIEQKIHDAIMNMAYKKISLLTK